MNAPCFAYPIFREGTRLYFANANEIGIIIEFKEIDLEYFDSRYFMEDGKKHISEWNWETEVREEHDMHYVFITVEGSIIHGTKKCIIPKLKSYLKDNVVNVYIRNRFLFDNLLEMFYPDVDKESRYMLFDREYPPSDGTNSTITQRLREYLADSINAVRSSNRLLMKNLLKLLYPNVAEEKREEIFIGETPNVTYDVSPLSYKGRKSTNQGDMGSSSNEPDDITSDFSLGDKPLPVTITHYSEKYYLRYTEEMQQHRWSIISGGRYTDKSYEDILTSEESHLFRPRNQSTSMKSIPDYMNSISDGKPMSDDTTLINSQIEQTEKRKRSVYTRFDDVARSSA